MRSCPNCQAATKQDKIGQTEAGSQRYQCRVCGKRYTLEPKARGYPEPLRQQAVALYSDGLSFRRIARQLGVNPQTVVNWITAYVARLPDQAPQPESVRVVEMDKLQPFIGQKKNPASA